MQKKILSDVYFIFDKIADMISRNFKTVQFFIKK